MYCPQKGKTRCQTTFEECLLLFQIPHYYIRIILTVVSQILRHVTYMHDMNMNIELPQIKIHSTNATDNPKQLGKVYSRLYKEDRGRLHSDSPTLTSLGSRQTRLDSTSNPRNCIWVSTAYYNNTSDRLLGVWHTNTHHSEVGETWVYQ